MGRDKYENEDLIKYGLPVDVWFHVDGLSSAHVYLRLPDGCKMEDIPADTLEDCAQLVKQNSIQGERRCSSLGYQRVLLAVMCSSYVTRIALVIWLHPQAARSTMLTLSTLPGTT